MLPCSGLKRNIRTLFSTMKTNENQNRTFTSEILILEKNMTASLLTHSYPVKVLIDETDKDFTPGMIAKVVLNSDVDNGIVVPANAVLINNDGKFVWVAKDGRATRQNITIAGYSGTGVVVSEGLHGGDLVIVEGYQKISEGMKVSYE